MGLKFPEKILVADSEQRKSAIPLGILLLFTLGLRVGELCGLMWGDIQKTATGYILHIRREVSSDGELLDHCKTEASIRDLELNPFCVALFRKIRQLNVSHGISVFPDDVIFQRRKRGVKGWTHCVCKSYDSRIRKYCREANMSVIKSCHDARRTCITNLFEANVPLSKLQYFAGHETLKQTLDYVRRKEKSGLAEFMVDDTDLINGTKQPMTQLTQAV